MSKERTMKTTRDLPTIPGYYWCRHTLSCHQEWEIVRIWRGSGDYLFVWYPGVETACALNPLGFGGHEWSERLEDPAEEHAQAEKFYDGVMEEVWNADSNVGRAFESETQDEAYGECYDCEAISCDGCPFDHRDEGPVPFDKAPDDSSTFTIESTYHLDSDGLAAGELPPGDDPPGWKGKNYFLTPFPWEVDFCEGCICRQRCEQQCCDFEGPTFNPTFLEALFPEDESLKNPWVPLSDPPEDCYYGESLRASLDLDEGRPALEPHPRAFWNGRRVYSEADLARTECPWEDEAPCECNTCYYGPPSECNAECDVYPVEGEDD